MHQKNNGILNPFWMDFWSLWSSILRPFWAPTINEKTSLLQGPLQGRPMDAKRLQNDVKWAPKALKMEPKWIQNQWNGSRPGWQGSTKRTKFECKSEFQLGLQASSNEVRSYRVSKNRIPAGTPSGRQSTPKWCKMEPKCLQNGARMEPKWSETAATWGDKAQKTNNIWMQIWISIAPLNIQRSVGLPCVQKHGRAGYPNL